LFSLDHTNIYVAGNQSLFKVCFCSSHPESPKVLQTTLFFKPAFSTAKKTKIGLIALVAQDSLKFCGVCVSQGHALHSQRGVTVQITAGFKQFCVSILRIKHKLLLLTTSPSRKEDYQEILDRECRFKVCIFMRM
jgi:hypothetical protein